MFKKYLILVTILILTMSSCKKTKEYSIEEIEKIKGNNRFSLLKETISKPGGVPFEIGKAGGTWNSVLSNDPKTFNTLTARDADSRAAIDYLYDSLVDYDPYTRKFKANLADYKVETNKEEDTLKVIYTLRDDLFWTLPDSDKKVKVTSDDVLFWYNEISGDKELQLPSYPGQFVKMKDGSEKRIEIEKINERSFVFKYPRIVAAPILSTSMSFGPKYIFEKVKKEKGIEGILSVFSADTDVKTIPSIGRYHLYEYTPGVRIVLKKNPYYFKKDEAGNSIPYIEKIIFKIVPKKETERLLFQEGKLDSYGLNPEDLETLLNIKNPKFKIYNGGPSLGSGFWTFNQRPGGISDKHQKWFFNTKFRQAMSCLLNRKRIISQVYRGLAVENVHFFAEPNPFFDEKVAQRFIYNPERAVAILEEIGIKRKSDGFMYDFDGNKIEFDLILGAESPTGIDMANIISDELKQVGITLKVRPIDFQKFVESLLSTYDWHSGTVSLSSNYWPTSGSNVWPSNGNFHLWNPLQKSPATDWEARIDYLYNEGSFTIDKKEAKKIWDEYQQLILDQNPIVYLVRPYSFRAVNNKWANVFYDTLSGVDLDYVYLRDSK